MSAKAKVAAALLIAFGRYSLAGPRSPGSQTVFSSRQTSDCGLHPLPVAVTSTTEGREPNA